MKGLGSNIKFAWSILFLLGLLAVLLPSFILAQEVKAGLDLRLVSAGFNDEVNPGEDNLFFIEITNSSSDTITNIELSADKPKDWIVEFTPDTIDALGAGNYRTVDVNIKPPDNISKGRYTVTVIADSADARRVMGIFVSVERGTSVWLWVGAIIAAVVITGFVIVFRRFGRE
jgi:uncharacterized membrane protein